MNLDGLLLGFIIYGGVIIGSFVLVHLLVAGYWIYCKITGEEFD